MNDVGSLWKRHYVDIKSSPPGACWQPLDTVLRLGSCSLRGDDGSLLCWSAEAMSNHCGDSDQ